MKLLFFVLFLTMNILYSAIAKTTETISFTYDDNNRVETIAYSTGHTVDYLYDGSSNILAHTISFPGQSPNNTPNDIENISIPDNAIDVSTTSELSWTGFDPDYGDEVAYYMYFGTDENNLELVYVGWDAIYTEQLPC